LVRWARAHVDPDARVMGVHAMPGNSGLSFGYDVVAGSSTEATSPIGSYVIRLAPPGVRRSGNTDVLRQAPLLRALEAERLPVAPLVWSTDDASWFGTDVIIQRKVDAKPLHMFEPHLGVAVVGGTDPYVRSAAEALAAVHAVDWRAALPDWQAERSVEDEIAFWLPLLRKTEHPSMALAIELQESLLATAPANRPTGILHGDYQTNNVLFEADGAGVVAIVDWELAGIGAQGLDVGWLAIMLDAAPWGYEQRARMKVLADPADVLAWYSNARGADLGSFDWYRALACYRYGVIAAFNLRLHRTGKRVDASYESVASSVPTLFEHGIALVGS
jgi:aminoglycoside phosphotransferase (APT) family kinase protein